MQLMSSTFGVQIGDQLKNKKERIAFYSKNPIFSKPWQVRCKYLHPILQIKKKKKFIFLFMFFSHSFLKYTTHPTLYVLIHSIKIFIIIFYEKKWSN